MFVWRLDNDHNSETDPRIKSMATVVSKENQLQMINERIEFRKKEITHLEDAKKKAQEELENAKNEVKKICFIEI